MLEVVLPNLIIRISWCQPGQSLCLSVQEQSLQPHYLPPGVPFQALVQTWSLQCPFPIASQMRTETVLMRNPPL